MFELFRKEAFESFQIWIAWRIPKSIAKWVFVRVVTHASMIYHDKTMGDITVDDCMKAWSNQ